MHLVAPSGVRARFKRNDQEGQNLKKIAALRDRNNAAV
jgi:hypothetical protein